MLFLTSNIFFSKRAFACRRVICRTSITGIEKCAAKLFQTHGGSDNESPKLSLPGNTFLIPSTAQSTASPLPSPSRRSLVRVSRPKEKRGPAVPRHPIFCPVHSLVPSWLSAHAFVPRGGWDSAGINSVSGEENSDVPAYRSNKTSTPLAFDLYTTYFWLRCLWSPLIVNATGVSNALCVKHREHTKN